MCNSRWFLFVLSVNEAPIDLGDCAMKKQNEFLLVTRIGKKSLHRFWLQPDRNFDVFFSAFDEDVEEISGDGVFSNTDRVQRLLAMETSLLIIETFGRNTNIFACLMKIWKHRHTI